MLKKNFSTTALIIITSTALFAQEYNTEIGVVSDNDAYLFYGQDRYYTNGLFLFYRSAIDQRKIQNANIAKITYELSAGQKMYNPISGYVPRSFLQDRPFAGYLFAAGKVSLFRKNEQVWNMGLALGTVGPNAFARETQEFLHQTIGLYETDGWDFQIQNAIAVNFQLQHTALLFRNQINSVDLSLESQLNIGTTFTNAGLGILFRTGNINPFTRSSYHHARISRNSGSSTAESEFYFYARPQLSYIAYDATIQGSLFDDNSPVTFDVRPLVFEQKLGVNYAEKKWTFDFGLVFRSKELQSDARQHQFGTISVFYRL